MWIKICFITICALIFALENSYKIKDNFKEIKTYAGLCINTVITAVFLLIALNLFCFCHNVQPNWLALISYAIILFVCFSLVENRYLYIAWNHRKNYTRIEIVFYTVITIILLMFFTVISYALVRLTILHPEYFILQ